MEKASWSVHPHNLNFMKCKLASKEDTCYDKYPLTVELHIYMMIIAKYPLPNTVKITGFSLTMKISVLL